MILQYWRNVDDADVVNCLMLLTELPIEQIKGYESLSGEQLNPVKELLAYELTRLVHGKEDADKCLEAAKAAFSGAAAENMPGTELTAQDFTDGSISAVDLLVKCGLVPSKGEGRRVIEQGA